MQIEAVVHRIKWLTRSNVLLYNPASEIERLVDARVVRADGPTLTNRTAP